MVSGFEGRVEQLEEVLPLLLDDAQVEFVFAGEELVHAPHTEPGFAGDVADGGGVVAAVAEDAFGGLEQAGEVGLAVSESADG